MIGRLHAVVLDCPNPAALAEFYHGILGGHFEPDGEWIDLVIPGAATRVSFQRSIGYEPPVWPSDNGDQQSHLDIAVADFDAAHSQLLALGARHVESHDGFRVYLDPVGHPFCTVD